MATYPQGTSPLPPKNRSQITDTVYENEFNHPAGQSGLLKHVYGEIFSLNAHRFSTLKTVVNFVSGSASRSFCKSTPNGQPTSPPWQKKNIPVHPCSYFLLILHMILFLLSHTCSTLKAEWWEEGERGTSEFSFQTSPSSIDRRKGEVCQLSGASLLSPSYVTSPSFILPCTCY